MKKTRGFLLAAGVALALAFTLSCSSDDGGEPENNTDGGGLNLPDLPKQVYFADYDDNNELRRGKEYEGDGDIKLRLSSYDSILIGQIQGGQISLNLPASLDTKYLRKFESDVESDDGRCQGLLDFTRNLSLFNSGNTSLPVITSGEGYCELRPILVGAAAGSVRFNYSSESGKIIGTQTCAIGSDGDTEEIKYELNFSKGWNLVYTHYDNDSVLRTTELSKYGTLEWWIRCDD